MWSIDEESILLVVGLSPWSCPLGYIEELHSMINGIKYIIRQQYICTCVYISKHG